MLKTTERLEISPCMNYRCYSLLLFITLGIIFNKRIIISVTTQPKQHCPWSFVPKRSQTDQMKTHFPDVNNHTQDKQNQINSCSNDSNARDMCLDDSTLYLSNREHMKIYFYFHFFPIFIIIFLLFIRMYKRSSACMTTEVCGRKVYVEVRLKKLFIFHFFPVFSVVPFLAVRCSFIVHCTYIFVFADRLFLSLDTPSKDRHWCGCGAPIGQYARH